MSAPGLISAVTPIFNAERFLREAIESVFTQTYAEWELILVDDGSSDASGRIAAECADRNPSRVSYVVHPGGVRKGSAASRNLGIAHARGEYIAFLDADDTWLPRKLERQIDVLGEHPDAGMVYGLSQWWYSWTETSEDGASDFVHPLGVPSGVTIEPPGLIAPFFVRQDAAIPNPGSILVRRSVIDEVGAFEEAFSGPYDDQALYAKICLHAPVVAVAECWDRYRQHPDSMTTETARLGREVEARLFFLDWLIRYLSDHGVAANGLCADLARQRFGYLHPRLRRLRKLIGRRYTAR